VAQVQGATALDYGPDLVMPGRSQRDFVHTRTLMSKRFCIDSKDTDGGKIADIGVAYIRQVRQHNRRIVMRWLRDGTIHVSIKTLTHIDSKPMIMRTRLRLTVDAMMGMGLCWNSLMQIEDVRLGVDHEHDTDYIKSFVMTI